MIKELIFTVARLTPTVPLLIAGLAYGQTPSGQTPSTSFTDNVVSSGSDPIACDIGPPYTGAVPAAAAQAGFTHCAANYDFTQTQQWTDQAGTHQWSNISSWLDCTGKSTNTSYLYWNNGTVPCNTAHQNIISDGGTQVLSLTYSSADASSGNYLNEIETGIFSGPPPGVVAPAGMAFPNEFYAEQVIRITTTNTCSDSCIMFDWSSSGYLNAGLPCVLSSDLDEVASGGGETYSSTVNTAFSGWGLNTCTHQGEYDFGPGVPSASPSPTTSGYTTYGVLMTLDDVTTAALCNYSASGAVGGLPASAFRGCTTWQPSSNPLAFNNRLLFYTESGPYSAGQGGNVWTASSFSTYIQRQTIWVCPNPTPNGSTWQTGQCYNDPVITTHP
jgi:hypothetical protein